MTAGVTSLGPEAMSATRGVTWALVAGARLSGSSSIAAGPLSAASDGRNRPARKGRSDFRSQ